MKVVDVNFNYEERQFICSLINNCTDSGVLVTELNFHYVEMTVDELVKLVESVTDKLSEQGLILAVRLLLRMRVPSKI
jgi:hypothetical protein